MNTAAVMTRLALVAALVQSGVLFADTLTIDPGDGVATNVTRRITGDTDVAVNPGASGGGIVTLGPRNTYTGTTSLGCGTLVATMLGDTGSSFGSTSGITLGSGTLRYAGADGGVLSAAVTSTVSSTTATVLDIKNDLSISGGYTQTAGAFIKTGAGTLTVADGDNLFDASTLTSPGSDSITVANTVVPLNLNANGDAPTQGYSGFTVAEGTFRIEGGRNAFGANCYVQIGAQGIDAEEAVLEIAGGENWFARHFTISSPRNVAGSRAGIRITGGTTTIGNGQSLFLGPSNDARNSAPGGEYAAFIEMTGGTLSAPKDSCSFFMGLKGKGKIDVDVSGGSIVFGKNMGFGFNDLDGTATNDVTFTIRDGGLVTASNAVYVGASPVTESVFRLNLLDGGKLSSKQLYLTLADTNAPALRPQMRTFIDGGIVEALPAGSDYAILPAAFVTEDVLIGTKGATFCHSSNATTTQIARVTANLVATNSVPGMEPLGVTFAKSSGKVPARLRLSTPGAWDGPTFIGKDATLDLYSDASGSALPATSDVTVDGTLAITRSGTVVVGRSLTVNGNVKLYTGATLALNGPISGDGKLLLYSNTSLTANGWSNGTECQIVTVPIAYKDSLIAFAKNCEAGVRPTNDKCHLAFNVTDDGARSILSMKYLTSASLPADDDKGYTVSNVTFLSVARLFIDAGYANVSPVGIKARRLTINDGYVKTFNTGEYARMSHLPKNSETSGVVPLEAKMILNGGTLHLPTDLRMGCDQPTKTGYASILVNGGNLIVEKNLYPNHNPTAAPVGNSITLNSGTILCNLLRCSNSTGSGDGVTYRPATITLNGGLFSTPQQVDLCYQQAAATAGAGSLIHLNSGATLRAPGINPTKNSGKVWFNGGTMQVTLNGGSSFIQNCEAVYVGAGGAIFDMSLNVDYIDKNSVINLNQQFLHDPDCAGMDGGVTVFGEGGIVLCDSGFTGSTITGPITVRDGGNFMACNSALDGYDLFVKPSATFRQFENTATPTMDNLTLGEAGASTSVVLRVYRNGSRSLPIAKVEEALTVLSPVMVATANNNYGVRTFDNNGVYTTLVYKAENSNVNVSLFRGYPTEGKTATFEIVDSAYSGYKAVVMTVANGNDPSSVATYTQVNDEWTYSPSVGGLNRILSVSSGTSAAFGGDSLDDFDGILYVNAAQSAETRGTSGFVTFGANSFNGFGGILYPRSGTVTIPSLAWMTDPSQLRLGFGTVRYTGTGETIPGFQTWPTGQFMSNLEVVNDLMVVGKTTVGANGAFMKSGSGTLTLAGTGDYRLGNNHNWTYDNSNQSNNRLCDNGDSATNGVINLSIAAGKIVIGSTDDVTAGPTVYTSAYAAIGVPSVEDPVSDAGMEINSGSFRVEKYSLFVGYYSGQTRHTHPKLAINGGSVSITQHLQMGYEDVDGKLDTRETVCSPEVVVNGGALTVGMSVMMGACFSMNSAAVSANTTSSFILNDGLVTVSNNFFVVHREGKSNRATRGVVRLNGGTLDIGGYLDLCRNVKTTGTLWLNRGATLKADYIVAKRGGGSMYFNGGEYLPYGTLTNELAGTTQAQDDSNPVSFYVSTNGAVISTANMPDAKDYVITAALKHDPALAGVDGGLVKKGAGTLVLSGANTYTGPTVVEDGTLKSAGAIQGVVDVRYGATFDLDGRPQDVGSISGAGEFVNGTVRITGSLTACSGFDEVPFVGGNLTGDGRICVDIGVGQGDPVPRFGTRFLLAEVTGSVAIRLRPVDGERRYRLVPVVEDGFLYAVVEPPFGAALIIR